jgi:hypothetical protein
MSCTPASVARLAYSEATGRVTWRLNLILYSGVASDYRNTYYLCSLASAMRSAAVETLLAIELRHLILLNRRRAFDSLVDSERVFLHVIYVRE